MNSRQAKLLEKLKSAGASYLPAQSWLSRDVALYRAQQKSPLRSLSQLRANTVLELIRLVPVQLTEPWLLAGEQYCMKQQTVCWGIMRLETQDDEFLVSELKRIAPDLDLEAKAFRQAIHSIWSGHNCAVAVGEISPGQNERELYAWGKASRQDDSVYMAAGWIENHSIRDYEKLLKIGYGGLRKEVEDELKRFPIHSVDYVERENFLRSALAICDAGLELGEKWARCAENKAANCADAQERNKFLAMAIRCRNVVLRGARTLPEAIQCLWFGHIVTCCEDGINANSLGRLDQILNPYYQEDLVKGRITEEEALEWLIELAIKLYLPYDVQAITLGGQTPAGTCAVNDMSYLFLEATGSFGELRDLSVRVTPDMPDLFLERCCRLVLRGGGIPFFFNDVPFIQALTDRGIALADARDYSPIGCIETSIPGKSNPHAVSGWINLLRILEFTIHNGQNPANEHQVGLQTGSLETFNSFSEFMDAFKQQIRFFSERMVYRIRRKEHQQRLFGPLPGWSLLTDKCIERGRDITDGGAVYNYHQICAMGIPDCADALMAIKKLVFDTREIQPEEIIKAMKNDFADNENMRIMLENSVPKYGNGNAEVDAIARELTVYFIQLMDEFSQDGNQIFVHLFTFLLNIPFGLSVGAMPDGRHAGSPLAYSLSAHQGRDKSGLSAMLQSLAQMPHNMAAGCSAAILDLHPSFFQGIEEPEKTLAQIIRGAFAQGVGQLQWNIVSAERLELAKKEPDKWGNLPVRVAGYSQLFKLITPELQDHIIARHKHT